MKRHLALQDLSRDHFTALLRAVHVIRAADGDARVPAFADARRALHDLWRDGLALHFDEEDETLRERLPPELRRRLDEDHAALRAGFNQPPAEDDAPAWAQLAEALRRHARWEEEHAFPWLQENLEEAALMRLWDASRAFRLQHRGPGSIGPPDACSI